MACTMEVLNVREVSTGTERKQWFDRLVKHACTIYTDLEENSNICLGFDRITFQLPNCHLYNAQANDSTTPLFKSKHEVDENKSLCNAFCYLLGFAELHEREIHRIEREAVKFPTLEHKHNKVQRHTNHNKVLLGKRVYGDFVNKSHMTVSNIMHTPEVCLIWSSKQSEREQRSQKKITNANATPYNRFMRYTRRNKTTTSLLEFDSASMSPSRSSSSSSSSSLLEQEEEEWEEKERYNSYKANNRHERHRHGCVMKSDDAIRENVLSLLTVKSTLLDEPLSRLRLCALCMAHVLFYAYWCNLREMGLLNTLAALHLAASPFIIPDNAVPISSGEVMLRMYHTTQRLIRLTLFLLDTVTEPITLHANAFVTSSTTTSTSTSTTTINKNSITSNNVNMAVEEEEEEEEEEISTTNNASNVKNKKSTSLLLLPTTSLLAPHKSNTTENSTSTPNKNSNYNVKNIDTDCNSHDNNTLELSQISRLTLGEFLLNSVKLITKTLSACSTVKSIVCTREKYSLSTVEEINQNIRINLLLIWFINAIQRDGTFRALEMIQNMTTVLLHLHELRQKTKTSAPANENVNEEHQHHHYEHYEHRELEFSHSTQNVKNKNKLDDLATQLTMSIVSDLSTLMHAEQLSDEPTIVMEYNELLCATALLTVFCNLYSNFEIDRNDEENTTNQKSKDRSFFYEFTLVEFLESCVHPFLVELASSSNGTLRLRGNQLESLYWWLRAEVQKFILLWYRENTQEKWRDQTHTPTDAHSESDYKLDSSLLLDINSEKEKQWMTTVQSALEAMTMNNKVAEEFVHVTMFPLDLAQAQMQERARKDVIIVEKQTNHAEKYCDEGAASTHNRSPKHVCTSSAEIGQHNSTSFSCAILPDALIKLWMTLCITLFRSPLTDLVQISHFHQGSNNNSDNNNNSNSNEGSTTSAVIKLTTATTNRITCPSTTASKTSTNDNNSKSDKRNNNRVCNNNNSKKDTVRNGNNSCSNNKNTTASKSTINVHDIISFDIMSTMSSIKDSRDGESKNNLNYKTEDNNAKRRLTLPLINEHHTKEKRKSLSNRQTSFREKANSLSSDRVKKYNSFSVQKLSLRETSTKRKGSSSRQASLRAADIEFLCDNDGLGFWERWTTAFMSPLSTSVAVAQRDVYELLSGYHVLKTEMSTAANAVNTSLPCSHTELLQIYFSGIETLLSQNTAALLQNVNRTNC